MLHPRYHFRRVWEIPPEWVLQAGLQALLLDVDNTLTTHDAPEVSASVRDWLKDMQDAGIGLLLLSNNSEQRVSPLAKMLGLSYVARSRKPLPHGLHRACGQLGLSPKQVAVVGDQLFTDVLCANLGGAVSILVDYMEKESMVFFRLKRRMEKWLYHPRYTIERKD